MGRLIGTSTQYSFLTGTFTNSYGYDAASNRTGYTAPDGSANTYSYDNLNRLVTLANSWAGSFGFSYDALSRRTQMTRPNGITTSYTYDNLSRLLSVLHQLSGSTIDGATYTVDNAGNRTSKADQLAGVTSNYGYDAIYELTQVTQGATTTESYSYDPVGNRLSSLGVSPYSVNSSNELTSTPSASYSYDSNGNLTSETTSSGTTSYTWDFENRLTQVTLPGSGGTVTFKYDPLGRRIEKISPNATSIFAYDGNNLIETVNSSGGVVAHYAQTMNIDEPLAMQRGTTTDYYEADGLGSITSLTASNASLAESYTYDSFGNITNSSGSLTNFFRYTGREFDTETNLYYYRARYYDPTVGRFLSEDSARFDAAADFYSYTRNNPTNFTDPTGLTRCDNGKCPQPWLQGLAFAEIMANDGLRTAYSIASTAANMTGNTVVVGLSGNVGGSLWPGGMLGGSAGVSVGLGVDPCGDIGLVVSGQVGGGYNPGTPVSASGGGSFTYTSQPTIFGLNGSSPVVGASGGDEVGGSVTHTLGGSTTVTVGAGIGFGTVGGVKSTKVFPLVCSSNCSK